LAHDVGSYSAFYTEPVSPAPARMTPRGDKRCRLTVFATISWILSVRR